MTNPIETYQTTLRSFINVTNKVTQIVNIILKASNNMEDQNWKTVMVSNSDPPTTFPREIAENPASIDAKTWPTGPQIASALSQWHSAKSAAQQSYQKIPEHQRTGIQPPIVE
mgnify:CR=1 FL=1